MYNNSFCWFGDSTLYMISIILIFVGFSDTQSHLCVCMVYIHSLIAAASQTKRGATFYSLPAADVLLSVLAGRLAVAAARSTQQGRCPWFRILPSHPWWRGPGPGTRNCSSALQNNTPGSQQRGRRTPGLKRPGSLTNSNQLLVIYPSN